MSLQPSYNQPWRTQPETIAAIIVQSPERNCLPLGLPPDTCLPQDVFDGDYQEFLDYVLPNSCKDLHILQPRSPYAEMTSILTTGERFGFDFYRSGGNSSIISAAPPGLAAYTPGVGAWLEQHQTISNNYNYSMEIVAEQGTILAVYGAGDIGPIEYLSFIHI